MELFNFMGGFVLRKRGIKAFLPAALQKLGKSGCNPRKPLAGVVGRWMEKGCEGLQLPGDPEQL